MSFEIDEGTDLSIIGRNGSGKSTLLKILSNITPPSTGQARIRGRVGALLEVGTSYFTLSLPVEADVYMNGTISGMGRRKFRELKSTRS